MSVILFEEEPGKSILRQHGIYFMELFNFFSKRAKEICYWS